MYGHRVREGSHMHAHRVTVLSSYVQRPTMRTFGIDIYTYNTNKITKLINADCYFDRLRLLVGYVLFGHRAFS